jgi:FtsZ-binding cell division protein ZapB
LKKKILEGKLVRVKVKEKKEYNTKNKQMIKDVIKIPKRKVEIDTDTEDVTDTDTDVEEVKNKSRKFKKVQKTIDKKIEEIKKIDETINQYKNPYLDKLMSLMK